MNYKVGVGAFIHPMTNLYGCVIGDRTKVGAFVEIQKGAVILDDCKISSHSFICEGVTIGNGVFVGHGVMFINDKDPRALNEQGKLEKEEDWKPRFVKTFVLDGASIGSNATIMGGVTIGIGAVIGAGAVVTKCVPAGETWVGNPARKMKSAASEETESHDDYHSSMRRRYSDEAKDIE